MIKHTIYRLKDVIQITSLSRSSIYDYMSKGNFPKPIKLGVRAVGWRSADIAAWLDSRVLSNGETQPLRQQGMGSVNSHSLRDVTEDNLSSRKENSKHSFCSYYVGGQNNV